MTSEQEEKVINFFVWDFQEKYQGNVWDIQSRVPRLEVTREWNDRSQGVGTSHASDKQLRSSGHRPLSYVWCIASLFEGL